MWKNLLLARSLRNWIFAVKERSARRALMEKAISFNERNITRVFFKLLNHTVRKARKRRALARYRHIMMASIAEEQTNQLSQSRNAENNQDMEKPNTTPKLFSRSLREDLRLLQEHIRRSATKKSQAF